MISFEARGNGVVASSIIVVTAALPLVARASICYVDGSRDCECGTSECACTGAMWDMAFQTLHEALQEPSCTDIRVAAGTYKPTAGTDRTASFALEAGVAIYGGFRPGGSDMEDRNPDRYETILSGDLNGDDESSGGGNSENSFHVLDASGATAASVLDGFTITGGNADGSFTSSSRDDRGGGILVVGGSPTIRRCTIRGNTAASYGGGLAVALSSDPPVIEDSLFESNTAGVEGGSIHVAGCWGQGDCEDDNVCTFADCVGSGCTYEAKAYGDVNGDGPVDVFDIVCMLDGFSGVFTTCTHDNLDIAPCSSGEPPAGGDGVVDTFDILAVLEAFGGGNPCGCVQMKVAYAGIIPKAKGAARSAKVIASSIEVDLVPRDTDVARGGTTVVDAYADDVENFRGYQLRLASEGGVPIAAFVDVERSDFVFAGREFRHKSDARVHRIVAALLEGEVTTDSRVYLGTFAVRADSGGGGTMEVRVHPDDGMILVDPQGRVHNAPAPEKAEVTVR